VKNADSVPNSVPQKRKLGMGRQAIATAHDENVSAWVGAIEQGIQAMGKEAVPLLELQGAIGMPLV
jgi:hypothetical protein